MLAAWQEREAGLEPALAGALAGAAAAIARLDEALALHPLRPAFLHRARLEAVRRQAAVDGQLIEPWHLAAVLEGLRLRMGDAPRIIDRGSIAAAAASALALYHWLVAPGCDEEGQIQQAAHHLAGFEAGATPLLAAAQGMHAWLDQGGTRPPMRAALVRFWVRHQLLRAPVPLTGAAALRAETPWARSAWTVAFLHALAAEAADGRQLLTDLERPGSRRAPPSTAGGATRRPPGPLTSWPRDRSSPRRRSPGPSASRSRRRSGCSSPWSPPASPSRSATAPSGGCSGWPAWRRCVRPCCRRGGRSRDGAADAASRAARGHRRRATAGAAAAHPGRAAGLRLQRPGGGHDPSRPGAASDTAIAYHDGGPGRAARRQRRRDGERALRRPTTGRCGDRRGCAY